MTDCHRRLPDGVLLLSMRYPAFLQPGGRIGFIAPSFGAVTEPYRSYFNHALDRFRRMGYRTVTGPNCFADCGIGKSNTSEACGAEINDFFTRDLCDVVLSCGGGETMCEDLPFVDFDAIGAAPPRWFMGYSDNTNLTLLLPTLCDTAAVYGPNASSFGMEPWHAALEDAFSLLTGTAHDFSNYAAWEKADQPAEERRPFEGYHATEPYAMKIFAPDPEVSMSGRLLGGCLDCLSILCGTRFDRVKEFAGRYREDGILWFIEACADVHAAGNRLFMRYRFC